MIYKNNIRESEIVRIVTGVSLVFFLLIFGLTSPLLYKLSFADNVSYSYYDDNYNVQVTSIDDGTIMMASYGLLILLFGIIIFMLNIIAFMLINVFNNKQLLLKKKETLDDFNDDYIDLEKLGDVM